MIADIIRSELQARITAWKNEIEQLKKASQRIDELQNLIASAEAEKAKYPDDKKGG